MKRRSYYKKFDYKGNYYIFSCDECEEIYIEDLNVSKELKEKLYVRASHIHEFVMTYDSLRFTPNDFWEKQFNKRRDEIIKIEEEIESLYGDEIEQLEIYHSINSNEPFEYEEQEFYYCSSCEQVVSPEEKQAIDDLNYECILNEGMDVAEEKYGGLCPLCNKTKSLYLQNIHCAKINRLIEDSQLLIEQMQYKEAIDSNLAIIKEAKKIDAFFKDLYADALVEMGQAWMRVVRLKNEMKDYKD